MQINVLHFLEKSASQFPDKAALVDENHIISFSRLEAWAKSIGSAILAEKLPSFRLPVMVLADRSAPAVVCFMGALYSGNYYVPIDIKTPQKRLQTILETLKPAIILYERIDIRVLDGLNNLPKCLAFEDIINENIDSEALESVRKRIIDTDPVYTIFTSGSTGIPKGIVVSHKGVIDLAEWLDYTFDFTCDDTIGNQTPFYFDASVKDIYICLKKGVTMYIIPKKLFTYPLLLIDYLNENGITVILWATSAINLIANSKVFDIKIPLSIRKVFFAGEAMYAKQLNIWRRSLPAAMYINLYGPTEVTVDCTYFSVNREFADDEAIPIGNACRNMEVLLLNEDYQKVCQGEPGQICVRGTGVALGYLNEPQRTDEVFIQNPLNRSYRDLIYCTGDIAKHNEYGELVFISRKDGQIKHMGYRIELGEIELAVNSLEGIEACICFYDTQNSKIIMEYVGKPDIKTVVGNISNKLPKYMIPNVINKKDKFLYNANGKIDRKRITESYLNGQNK